MKILAHLPLAFFVGAIATGAKEIDLAKQTDTDGQYNVAYCARPSPKATGLPGHMFVAFSSTNSSGERSFVAVGHTVGADVSPSVAHWSYFGAPVNGLLQQEMYTSIKQECLDVRVNKEDFERAFSRTVSPLAALGIASDSTVVLQEYRLGAEDCVKFVSDVATVLKARGLIVPIRKTSELPMEYIQRMIGAN